MLIVCESCGKRMFHRLRSVIAEEDGNEYTLGTCVVCDNKVIIACECGIPVRLRHLQDGNKIRHRITYCPVCDRLDEMACPPTQRSTCGSTCDSTEAPDVTKEA